ncbi:MAG: hypothetical protein DLM52_04935 [Chthoniobacterales bacterium]|nr:MAG: hypothetical protein DLM52_04935 [Chthoniobacterales bacterium]
MHKHLRRVERAWLEPAIYFVTTCTRKRQPLLATQSFASILIDEPGAHQRHGCRIGSYAKPIRILLPL